MAFKKYNSANNAVAQLNLPLADTDTTCVLKWKFWRFPTSNFIMKATHVENGVVTGRENIYVATRSGATCTGLIRAYEPVPTDDDATTNIQQALNFSADDIVEVVVSSEFMKDMQEEIDAKLAKSGWLRTWFWVNKTVYVEPATGNEVLKNSTSSVTIQDTEEIIWRNPSTWNENRVPFANIKNQLASVWKYVQNIPAWESISSWNPTSIAIIWLPIIYSNTLGSNVAWNRLKSGIRFLVPYNTTIGRVKTSQLSNSSSARVELYQDDWTTLISSQPKKPDDINFIPTLTANIQSWYTLTTDCPDSAYKAFDNNAWTNLYTWNVNWRYVKVMMPAKKRANRVTLAAWAGESQTIASATVYWVSSTGVETLLTTTWVISRSAANFDFVNDIEYQWFKVVFWAPSGSYSGSYEIVSVNFTQIETADTFDFSNISITWNEIYRLFVNDSAFFNGQNNELALSSYQSSFPFCISWTLNGTNTVEPQNIKEIQLWTKKAMKAVANSSDEYAILAWFITWPKNKWDLLELNANDWTLVSWFSWLTPLSKYYVSNTSWVISTTAWIISRIVWMAVSPTELYISSSYYPWTTITKP